MERLGENGDRICIAPEADREKSGALAAALGILEPTAALLIARGIETVPDAKRFFAPGRECFHDPFLLEDMEKAAERIERALAEGERIVVYGDYDVDGVTSLSLLCLYLRERGASPGYYIPDRLKDGYGMNRDAVRMLAQQGTRLIITVDTGTTAPEEVALAASLGIDTVVTDHHACHGELPRAVAVVNPMRPGAETDPAYPFPGLAGVGVALKLVCAMEMRRGALSLGEAAERVMDRYGDLVAIGTVADVMPMLDENRYLVSKGLEVARSTRRPGLAALMQMALGGGEKSEDGQERQGQRKYKPKPRPLTSSSIGFALAPRINAAGRMASADLAAELFLTDSEFEGKSIASALCDLNLRRQEEEQKIFREAVEMIDRTLKSEDRIIVLHKDGWHHGVIGIVSSRLSEHYRLPVILISFDGDVGKGSGRSLPGLHLVETLAECGDLLLKFGGHEFAAGLTIERKNIEAFEEKIRVCAAKRLTEKSENAKITADAVLPPEMLILRFAEELERMEPFGMGNPKPQFYTDSFTVQAVVPLSGGKHTKLLLSGGRETGVPALPLLAFGRRQVELGIREGDTIDALYYPAVNEFQGNRSVQLLMKEIVFSPETRRKIEKEERLYRVLLGETPASAGELPLLRDPMALLPLRKDFVAVYSYLTREYKEEEARLCCRGFSIFPENGEEAPGVRMRMVLAAFHEVGILDLRELPTFPGTVAVKLRRLPARTKMNVEGAAIYQRFKKTLRELSSMKGEPVF